MNLTNEQLRELRSSMEEAMTRIYDTLEPVSDGFNIEDSQRDQTGELSLYDNHPGDIGSETFERGKDLALRELYSLHLNELDEALERMEEGTYGNCLHCGGEIPFERLQVQPSARYCMHCQEEQEAQEIEANRPVEENFLYPGFGRTFMDENDEDQNGFDGEDSWQAVARYGSAQTNDDNPYATEPNHFYVDAEERLGYVEDIEGFLIADIHGNPVEPGFVRNEPYQRAFSEAEEDL